MEKKMIINGNETMIYCKDYLKVLDESKCGQLWWNGLSDCDKQIIKSIPNFDPDIFYECTGIKVN